MTDHPDRHASLRASVERRRGADAETLAKHQQGDHRWCSAGWCLAVRRDEVLPR